MITFLNRVNLNLKQFLGLLGALLIFVVSLCLPSFDFISVGGIRTIGLLVSFLVILITSALPVVVTSILFIGLVSMSLGTSPEAPALGLKSLQSSLHYSLSGFSEPVVYFTLASFGLTAAITTTPLSKRILKGLLKLFGNNIQTVILAIMITACLISSLISNVPTCAVFSGIAINFLDLYDKEEDKKKTGKALMIAIPIASMIGGMMTPAGSSINLMAIGILEKTCGVTISFVQWMIAGVPLAIVMLPLSWLLVCKIYKPVQVGKEKIKPFADN